MASKNPNALIVASEVYLSGIGSLLKNIETFSVDNANIVRLDYRVTETGLDNKNMIQQIIRSISGPSASSIGL